MADQTKIVKGGFRATLALVISIIALILSVMTYSSSRDEGLNAQVQNLQATMEKMKTESAGQVDRLRNEMAQTLDKMSNALKIEERTKKITEKSNKGTTN